MTDHAPAEVMVDAVVHDTNGTSNSDLAKYYDIMPKMMPHLDRHLIFPLLEFMQQQDTFSSEELLQSTYDLLKPTNMTDYVASLWKQLHNSEDVPDEFSKKRDDVLQELKTLEEATTKILELLDDKDVIANIRQDKVANLQYLKDNHGVSILQGST